ncbi:SBBP repeat-containing protein [Alkalihalobacillus alcalophilus]|uniref:SBBP repeat-containing protein n=1 Tax=Alkalihalobacillus alcalophilus TaxID=1445 RepID=UPI00399CE120
MTVDQEGNAYVTGITASTDFPTTSGAFSESYNGGFSDAFISKLNPSGTGLVYSTYLGGNDTDEGYEIALDEGGNAYVVGYTTSPDFPTTTGAFDPSYNGIGDAFISKLNPNGTGLVYSTYLGGSSFDEGQGIKVDEDGNAYVVGYTTSADFPTTAGAYDQSYNGNLDVFISKLNPSGTDLVYSTYLGGTGDDWGIGIAIDQGGNAYVTGYTESANFPTTSGAYDQSFNGSIDVYITKLNPSGTDLVYSTYLGGSDADLGRGIAIDQGGNAYVTGNTTSPNFPTTAGAFQNNLTASNDVFVTIINSIGNALVYSTFLGGSADETGWGIAVDQFGSAYVTGATNSIDFPTTPMAQQTFNAGSDDVFVTKIGLPFQMVQGVTGPTGPRGPRGKDGRFPPNVLPPFRSCCRRRHRFERRSF